MLTLQPAAALAARVVAWAQYLQRRLLAQVQQEHQLALRHRSLLTVSPSAVLQLRPDVRLQAFRPVSSPSPTVG